MRKFDCGHDIFGNGLLLSDAAAERLAEYILLSKRERELQQSIGKDPAKPV